MEIRKADPEDHAAIWAAVHRTFRDASGDRERITDRTLKERYAPGRLGARLNRDDTVCLLAEKDQEVVGFAEGTTGGTDGQIEWLHVTPSHHGEGVGTVLFERLREELRAADQSTRSSSPS